jgi:hypothetical protein
MCRGGRIFSHSFVIFNGLNHPGDPTLTTDHRRIHLARSPWWLFLGRFYELLNISQVVRLFQDLKNSVIWGG